MGASSDGLAIGEVTGDSLDVGCGQPVAADGVFRKVRLLSKPLI
jgi:hypothetical protein